MATGFPVKANYATGDVLTAANMNDLSGTLNYLNNVPYNKNAVINGGFDIWQRGISSSSLNGYYTADRWVQGTFSGTGTFAQDTTNIVSGTNYSFKFTASATAQPYSAQVIESLNSIPLAGKQVTLSGYFASSASSNLTFKLDYTTSTDSAWNATYTSITPDSGSESITTTSTLTRKSITYTIPATAKTLRVIWQTASTIATSATVTVGAFQLEVGSTATPFSRAGGTIQGELAACQRYYYRQTVTNYNQPFGMGQCYSTTQAFGVIQFPVTMRTAPTALEQNGTAGDYKLTTSVFGGAVCTSVPTFNAATTQSSAVVFTVASGLTAGNATGLQSGQATGYLGWSAEL